MLRQMVEEDYSLASSLIRKVNRSAGQIFARAWAEGKLVQGLVMDEPLGVAAVSEFEEFWVCQLSFTEDVVDEAMLQQIDQLLAVAIAGCGEKDLYLNMYGGNATLIQRYQGQGFVEDTKGHQLRYQASQGVPGGEEIGQLISPLEFRRFEEEVADLYIEVTDEAFRPLDLALGYEPYGSKRHRDQVILGMKRRDEQGEFGSFWLEGELVGIFILNDDYIHTIAVHPQFQSQGLGSKILQYCIYHLVENKGYDEIYLSCVEINQQGLHYYQKNNFQIVGYYSENTYRPGE